MILIRTGTPPPPQLLAPQLSGTNFTFRFVTSSGQSCTVWANTNLATTNWLRQTNFVGNGGTNQVWLSLPCNVPQQFYRLSQP